MELNFRMTIEKDEFCDDEYYTLYDLINLFKCETYLATTTTINGVYKASLKRRQYILKEMLSRFNIINHDGIHYVVIKENFRLFKDGILDSAELFEIPGFISKKEFKMKNIGCSVGYLYYEGDEIVANMTSKWNEYDIDFIKPFDISVCPSYKQIEGVNIDGWNMEKVEKICRKLGYLRE